MCPMVSELLPDFVFIYFNSAVQPDLEHDGSLEILVVNKKLRSRVWNDFVLTQVDDGTYKATCKHCKHAYVAGNRSGTSHLKYHLGVCPKILSSRKRKSPRSDIPIFDQQRSRDDFYRMVLGHGYPFNMAEHYYTRTFIYNLQPSFKLVHRTALKDDCMKIYDEERLRMYQLFDKQPGRFSITSDMWTHTEMSGYMSMTAHYIDDSWKLHSSLIGFAYVETPHNGEHIGKEIISRLYPWNLDRKLFSFSLDNCKVNNVVIRDLKKLLLSKKALHMNGDLFHIRCASHVLNLVVQDGLTVISQAIVKIRETVKYVNGSTLKKEKFRLYAQQVKAPNLSLRSDVPTRWNSTYLMLERAIKFREAFDRMQECDSSYKFLPSNDDWKHIQCLIDCLKVFYDVTKRISGTKYPTASLYFNDFCGIYILLRDWQFSDDTFVATMAVPMVKKFEKYWDISSELLEIATILDPRFKVKSIEYFYGLLYDEFVADLRVKAAKKAFSDLFGEYAIESPQGSSNASTSRTNEVEIASSQEPSSSLFATRLGLEKFIYESNSTQNKKSELEVYLEDPLCPEISNNSFDILAWWRINGLKYPILSRMARDVLSVPVSTVASESAFSCAKRILDEYRCNLLPETIEAIMCSHDWLKGRIPGTMALLNVVYDTFFYFLLTYFICNS